MEDQTAVLVSAEPEGHVQLLHALVTLHFGERFAGQECDRDDWRIRAGVTGLVGVESQGFTVVISLLHFTNEIGLVEVKILNATGVVLEDTDALLDVGNTTDVELE